MVHDTHGGRMRFVKKVNERGVLTLPNDIREALGVEEGDIVEFEIVGVVKKKNDAQAQSTNTTIRGLA